MVEIMFGPVHPSPWPGIGLFDHGPPRDAVDDERARELVGPLLRGANDPPAHEDRRAGLYVQAGGDFVVGLTPRWRPHCQGRPVASTRVENVAVFIPAYLVTPVESVHLVVAI